MKTQPSASPPRDGEKDREMEGYEQDFYAWTQRTAELLRAGGSMKPTSSTARRRSRTWGGETCGS